MIGDAKPAAPSLLVSCGQSVKNRLEHDHPTWEDLYCLNLTSYMGERMGPVLRRLLDAEARAERYRTAWKLTRTRAISTGGAADRYAARARAAQEALQHMLFAVIAGQLALHEANRERQELRARAAELEASPLGWARLLDAKSLDNFMIALGMAADTDPADGALSQVEEMIRSFRAAVSPAAVQERARTLHDHIVARDAEIERLKAQVAELEAAQGAVYRASHDSIVMGLYRTAAEARKHCESEVRREHNESPNLSLWWREDEDTVDRPEDGAQELIESTAPHYSRPTGYLVTPLEVASEYDDGADE
ncbi:hypothetical protein GTY54_34600 [Streptomyces sp. SID625]|nr:hypothetical protein [Streptomyces sp. SID625]